MNEGQSKRMILKAGLPELELISSGEWAEYALLDSGGGLKLEQYGPYTLVRPEPEAIWQPALPKKRWETAQAIFQAAPEENGGRWSYRQALEPRWSISYQGLRFWLQTSSSRHVGVFPEQAPQWDWIGEVIRKSERSPQVLNLFGYTGLASLAAAAAGGRVTHVDASRKVITWAQENQALSGLDQRPIRWIVDDAIKFVRREARRGVQYDGLILDPPKFGRGPKGEVWEFYKLLPSLLEDCRAVLSKEPLFVVLTAYAVKASPITLYNAVSEMMRKWRGRTGAGEAVLVEESAGRLLSMAIFARWQAGESND